MDRIDIILCDFIKIMPIVFNIDNAIDKAKSRKNISFNFSYPGYGSILLTRDNIYNLYKRSLSHTKKSIFNEICFLVKDIKNYKKRILEDIFIFLYILRSIFYGIKRALIKSREYSYTGKIFIYYFIINFPIYDKPKKKKKIYNNNKLLIIENISCKKKLVDPFNFRKCQYNLDNLPVMELKNLNKYLDIIETKKKKKINIDKQKIIIDSSDDNIIIDFNKSSGSQLFEFTEPINICQLKCNDCKIIYY